MTDGSSLSENEWLSRRKWTSMTFASVDEEGQRRGAGHGTVTGAGERRQFRGRSAR